MTNSEKNQKKLTLDSFREIVHPADLEGIRQLAIRLKGLKVLHINSTQVGGGVAEILHKLVPLMNDIGIETSWNVIEGDDWFFKITKRFHNALHGEKQQFRKEMFDHYREVNLKNSSILDETVDVIIIHDPQPLALVEEKRSNRQRRVWRCHIDLSRADKKLWQFMAGYVEKYDASVFSMPEFSRPLTIPQYMISPSIDPISEKNKPLRREQVRKVLEKHGIDPGRPVITQVSRFDRLKDPHGVIDVYRMVKKRADIQLVLAGGAADDDPEGQEVLAELQEKAGSDPDIHLLNLPPFSDLELNALVRGSTIIIQKSIREGFGLTVTEALWKKKPVIASPVGGIKRQILHNITGIAAYSAEGFAFHVRRLLSSPGLMRRLGQIGHAHVTENFLITRHLRDYMLLLLSLRERESSIVYLD